MLNSLRARLMLSYLFLITIVIFGVGAGIFWSIRDNPALYRSSVLKLQLVAALLTERFSEDGSLTMPFLRETIELEADRRLVRLILTDPRGNQLLDTNGDGENGEILISKSQLLETDGKVLQIKDVNGEIWLYTTRTLGEEYQLIITVRRPRQPWIAVLREDFFRPIVRIGLLSLFAAIILGYGLSSWISRPLRRMVDTVQKISTGHYEYLPIEGPKEVRQLVESYNLMASTVKSNLLSQKEFIANVSHEIRTPLTSIKGFAQALMEGTVRNSSDIKRSSKIIFQESVRMQRMADELLSLIKLESGTFELDLKKIDVVKIMKSVIEETNPLTVDKKITVIFNQQEKLFITGDEDKLHQVFTNLVENGIKFSPNGGKIVISVNLTEHDISIIVTDEGPGIPPGEQERIFERFYQVDKSRSGGSNRGTGLGLTIANQIVQRHSGKIWVESDGINGSKFIVRLPIRYPDGRTGNGSA